MIKVIGKLKKYLPRLLSVLLLFSLSFSLALPVLAQDEESPSFWSDPVGAVSAGVSNAVTGVLEGAGNIFENLFVSIIRLMVGAVITVEGWALIVLSKILIGIVQYNDFVNAKAVNVGWTLVRDVSNLFFVLVVLAIAIGTILRIESYNFKKFLPKVLIMAVLVNFSLTIAGLILDFAQVIMMTFVAAFVKVGGGGNLMQILQVNEMINAAANTQSEGWTAEIDVIPVVATAFLAVIMLMIAIIVILVMVVMFVARMVMLWFLLVLSPLPYILSAFPQGMRYAQQWWSEFTKYVLVGPVLAFFLWLSFAVVEQGQVSVDIPLDGTSVTAGAESGLTGTGADLVNEFTQSNSGTGSTAIFSGIGDVNKLLSLIIGIGMLMAGLVIAQQMGTAGGSFAGAAFSNIRRGKFIPGQATALRWTGKRADDLFAKVNAPLFRRIGETSWGRKRGFDQLGREGGLRLRSIPAAWQARGQRVEGERMRLGTQALTDVFNRTIPFNQNPTNATRRARAGEVAAEQRLLADTTTDAEEVLNKLRNEDLDKTGKVKAGREVYAIAKLRQLTADHNANEIVLQAQDVFGDNYTNDDVRLAGLTDAEKQARKLDRDSNGNIKYTTHNVQEAVRHMFKDYGEEFQAEVAFDLGEVGFANKDGFLYKMGNKNIQNGKFELMTKDKGRYLEQQDIAEKYAAKKEGRRFIQTATWQGFLEEVRPHDIKDPNKTHTMGAGMSEFAMINLERNPKAMVAEFHMASNEIKDRLYENVDVMLETARVAEQSGNTMLANNIRGLAYATIGFKYGGRNGVDRPNEVEYIKKNGGIETFANNLAAEIAQKKSAQIGQVAYDNIINDIRTNTYIPGIAPEPTPTPAVGAVPSAPRMAQDFDRTKHDRTREMVDRYQDAGLNFFESADFNPEQFEAEKDFRWRDYVLNKRDRDKIVLPAEVEEGALQAGVGLNFDNEEVRAALGVEEGMSGAYYDEASKFLTISKIAEVYRKQLLSRREEGRLNMTDEGIDNAVNRVREGLGRAKTLRVFNTSSTDQHEDIKRHEEAHASTMGMSDQQLDEYWNSLNASQRRDIQADLRKRYGYGISNQDLKREAVAEMAGVGKGVYAMNNKTRAVLEGMGIKSRGEASVEKMSEAASAARAFGSKVGKGFDKVGAGVGTVASAIKTRAGQVAGKVDEVLEGAMKQEELDALQTYRSSRSTLRGARSQYDTVKTSEESYIRERESEKRQREASAKALFDRAKQAEAAGNVGEAKRLTNEGNQELQRNDYIDTEISSARERLKKAADEYAKAASDTLRAKEMVDSIRGVPSAAARSAVRQAARETSPAAQEAAASRVNPQEYVKAAQEEVAQRTEEVQEALKGSFDSTEVVQALSDIENVLTSMQSSLAKLPQNQVNQNAKTQIAQALGELGRARQGGTLDPTSTSGLLTSINNGIRALYRSQGKKNPPSGPREL
ncbi:MAG: hypothetical protein HUU49_02920 [Candidatus Buchananbacteria bacterium]|nr:hypothetical protein [Candidatus Buchananbacteria bacterium]